MRNAKKTLDIQSLGANIEELEFIKRYQFAGGQIDVPYRFDEAIQSVKNMNNFNNSLFGGSGNEKSEPTRYQTNHDISSNRTKREEVSKEIREKANTAFLSVHTIQNCQSYKNPYPGYAFKFENVDDYTQKSTKTGFFSAN